MRRRLLLAGFLLAAFDAQANGPPPKPDAKKEEPAAAPSKPSSLTGNALPHCEPGQYPAGHVCKPAPPGYYAPAETRFLVSCPRGMTSKPGSRAPSECF